VSGYGASVCMIVTGVFASVWLWHQCVHVVRIKFIVSG